MKVYLHYTIWNKESMIEWLCRGIHYFIPKGSVIDIVLDHCIDGTENNLKAAAEKYLKGYEFNYYHSENTNRWQCTNEALQRFLNSDCDIFLSPQDDQKIQDSKLIEHFKQFNPMTTGIIGMRDGLTKDGTVVCSAHHSVLANPESTRWLNSGEALPVDCINDGPVAIFKPTAQKIGLFDTENFHAFYTEYDYALRCKAAGLTNYVMGVELVHEKFGNVLPSQYYNDNKMSAHDMESLRRKHW